MTVILIIGYIIAGMIVCGLFYYLDSDHEDSPALILVGLAWPVIIMLCLGWIIFEIVPVWIINRLMYGH